MRAQTRALPSCVLTLVTLACAVSVSIAPAAKATPLPDPSVTATVLFNLGSRKDTALLGSIGLADPAFGSVDFTSSGTPSPSLVASAQIGPNATLPSLFGRGSGILSYSLQIVGPAGAVPVLIDVAGVASASATQGASFAVVSSWSLFDFSFSNMLAGDEIRSGQSTGSFDQSFGHTVGVTLDANQTYVVSMLADASAAATDAGSHAIADASVDPTFSFGPGVDPLVYSFEFSSGIGNTPVPEPGTLALLSVGLPSLGLVRRRAR